MELEELTKTQIVLLTLLVSFMTSIATGIVTVTLLDQAPPAITRNINRVVERTVERVVPTDTQNARVVTTEKTVVVKESDLITESIDANAKSLVRISRSSVAPGGAPQLVGLGVFVTRGGIVATDSSLVTEGNSYTITTNTGKTFQTIIQDVGTGKPTALLRVLISGEDAPEFTPIVFATDLGVLKLGQTVISLSGGERTNVSIGIIAAIDSKPSADTAGESPAVVNHIRTDVAQTRLLLGSPLFDLFGETIGIHTALAQGADTAAGFTPMTVVRQQVAQFVETAE